jgi:hypothetical protein
MEKVFVIYTTLLYWFYEYFDRLWKERYFFFSFSVIFFVLFCTICVYISVNQKVMDDLLGMFFYNCWGWVTSPSSLKNPPRICLVSINYGVFSYTRTPTHFNVCTNNRVRVLTVKYFQLILIILNGEFSRLKIKWGNLTLSNVRKRTVIGWVTKIYLFKLLHASEGTLSCFCSH